MKKQLYVLLSLLILTGCFAKRKGIVTKTSDGVIFNMSSDGKMTYKDKDIEASMDTKKRAGIVEDIIKIWTLKEINKRN